jgi:nitrate/TMAO reductase-like tetraheme cytochrome c subunit
MALERRVGLWAALAAVVVLVAIGLNAWSARSEFCGSCHDVMGEHYVSWANSTHGEFAECLDCHSEPGWAGYYHAKVEGARNALSYYFGIEKTEQAPPPGPASCLRSGCHTRETLVSDDSEGAGVHAMHLEHAGCVECHGAVGHADAEAERAPACSACHGDSAADF